MKLESWTFYSISSYFLITKIDKIDVCNKGNIYFSCCCCACVCDIFYQFCFNSKLCYWLRLLEKCIEFIKGNHSLIAFVMFASQAIFDTNVMSDIVYYLWHLTKFVIKWIKWIRIMVLCWVRENIDSSTEAFHKG